MAVYIGLDIGGTKFMAVAADARGNLLRRVKCPTPHGLNDGLDLLISMAREVAGDDPIIAFGASAGGPLNYETGVISPLHQPDWRDVPLKSIFEGEFGRPLSVDVDTNTAALAEYYLGGEAVDTLLYVTLSTGMGGGLVVNGKIYRGSNSVHPEIGHQAVPSVGTYKRPVICACGAEGCLEALVSGNGIQRLYCKPASELDEAEWREVATNLGMGLRNMAALYAPSVIAIGGGVAVGGGEPFIAKAARVMADGLRLVPAPQVRLSRLGYDTALHGAVALAMTAVDSQEEGESMHGLNGAAMASAICMSE